jgi:hypothetical protein
VKEIAVSLRQVTDKAADRGIAFSPGGEYLLLTGNDSWIRDLTTERPEPSLPAHSCLPQTKRNPPHRRVTSIFRSSGLRSVAGAVILEACRRSRRS